MSRPVLQVSNVGKAYRQYHSEISRVLSWFGLPAKPAIEHWVLRGVSFEVMPGETVGIVGQNGAGKSTLLKLITGTQQPSEGTITSNGRIAAILELGIGFNPEFTGRQNAYHSARLMGFSQNALDRVMPQIETFAEIGDYFDHPVSTYSSGMQMRVAFSVVTAFRPEVLIVDEALSVGDTYFQHKSFSRIREFQQQGTTLLIVSHDRGAIQSLCNRAILLEKGLILKDGDPEVVVDYYNALIAEKENSTVQVKQLENGKTQTVSGTGEATIAKLALLSEKGERIEVVSVGQPVILSITVKAKAPIPELVVGYLIKDRLGQPIFGTNTYHLKQVLTNVVPEEVVRFNFRFFASIGPGTYSIAISLHSADTHVAKNYEWRDLALIFEVVNVDQNKFVGVGWMPPKVECLR